MQVIHSSWHILCRFPSQNRSTHSFSRSQERTAVCRCRDSVGLRQSTNAVAENVCDSVWYDVDRLRLASLLSSVTTSSQGNAIHGIVICLGLDDDEYLANLLISMYGRCGALLEACAVFDSMITPNIVSWTALITCFVKNGHSMAAVEIFKDMKSIGMEPNIVTFLTVMSACINLCSLHEGRMTYACVVEAGLDSDIAIGTSLINFYEKFNLLEDTCIVFSKMHLQNVVAWTSMIAAYAGHNRQREAVLLFWHMQDDGVEPNAATFVNVLVACGGSRDLLSGRLIHTLIVISGFDTDIEVGTSLVTMYGKCMKIWDAASLFRGLRWRNLVSWTAMMTVYKEHEKHNDCLILYKQMYVEGCEPDKITFITVLNACAGISSLLEGMRVHMTISCFGLETDVLVASALVDMYSKVGALPEACYLFSGVHHRDAVLWSAMISGCILNGYRKDGLQLFQKMLQEGVEPDEIAYASVLGAFCNPEELNDGRLIHSQFTGAGLCLDVAGGSLITMYANCGEVEEAIRVFQAMQSPDAVASNAVITACVQFGAHEKALELFSALQQRSHELDEITFTNILNACAGLAALQEGRKIHALVIAANYLDSSVDNALINFYSKSGCLKDLRVMFDKLSLPSMLSWTTFMTSYAQHGLCKEALFVFSRMQDEGFVPDEVALLSVLSSCSHAGMVDAGADMFMLLCNSYKTGLTVDHIVVLVDLFGRAGRLMEAECCLASFPFGTTSAHWSSLLSSSLLHNDISLGRTVATYMLDVDPFIVTSWD